MTAVAALFVAGTTFAYFTTTGSGLLSAIVGSLGQPSINSTTAGDGSMTLGWSSVASPGGQGTVSYYVTRNNGSPSGNCPTSAAPSTVTSCTDTGLAPGTYNYTVTAVWGTWTATSATSSPTVTVGTVDHFSVTVPATSTAGSAFNVTVAAKDVNNSTVTSYAGTVHFTSTDGQAALPNDYTFVAGDNGSHTFTNGATLKTAGSKTIDVKDSVQTSVTGSGTVTVSPAGAASLSLAAATTSPTAGVADNLTITAQDAFGNTATSYAGSKNLTFSGANTIGANHPTVSNSTGTAINFGTTTAITFTSGVASVSGSNNGVMKLYKAESVNVVVSDGTINNGTGLAVTAGSASASSLSLSAASTSPTAGAADNLTITAFDAYGNTATGYTGSKNLTFSGAHTIGSNSPTVSDSSGTPVNFGTATALTFTSGVASVSGSNNGVMKLYKVESVNITVTDGTLSNGTGVAVNVGVATASSLTMSAASTTPNAGATDNLTITAFDAYGNTDTGYTGSKSLTFSGAHAVGANNPTVSNSTGTAVAFGSVTTITFTNGAASVSGSNNGVMKLYKAESVNIVVSDGTISNGTGLAVTVSPLSATSLSLAAATTTPTAGAADNLTISALDTYGNTATTYTGSKSLTFSGASVIGANHPTVSSSTGTATNFGTATAITFTSGVASVSGSNNGVMKLYKAESVNIVVSDGTINNGTGMAVTVSAASAGVLAITPTGISGSTASNANLGPLTVSETDAYGNTSTTAETVNLSSSAGSSFATSQFGGSVTSVSIPGGSSSTTFYFGNTTTGSKTITAAVAGLTSGTQTVTTTTAPAGLFISITSHTGGTLTQSGCSTVSANYTCTVTGTGNGGSITFNVLFTNSSGTGVVYSTSQSSTISMTGQSSGSTTIAANSTTSGTTLTASHLSTTPATSTLTFGPYTLNVSVGK